MPIYEYHCTECSADFELLVQGSQEPHCPKCESAALEKKWSAFATQGGTSTGAASAAHAHGGGCGCCGGGGQMGSCGLN
jgi:putative FmdB family regulatory protein